VSKLKIARKSQIPLRYLVRSWSQTGSKLVGDQLRTSFEPDSVMEFGFNWQSSLDCWQSLKANVIFSEHMAHLR